ncbi:MAG: hypothetical protein U0V70_22010, partial [Terriglobia bacterium]
GSQHRIEAEQCLTCIVCEIMVFPSDCYDPARSGEGSGGMGVDPPLHPRRGAKRRVCGSALATAFIRFKHDFLDRVPLLAFRWAALLPYIP